MAETRKCLSVNLHGDTFTARNDFFRVAYSLSSGTWNYMDRTGYTIVKNAYAKAFLSDDTVLSTLDEGKRWFIAEEFEDDIAGAGRQMLFLYQAQPNQPTLKVSLRCYHNQPYMVLRTAFENTSNSSVTLKGLNLIDTSPVANRPRGGIYLGSEPTQYNVFLNSCTPTPTGFQGIYDGFTTEQIRAHENRSDGILYDKLSERAIVFGFLSFKKWWSSIQLGYDTKQQANKNQRGVNIWAMHHQCDTVCAPGDEILSEPVYINFAASASQAQQEYASLLAKHMAVPPPAKPFVSWTPAYLQSDSVNEAAITEELGWLSKSKSDYPKLQNSIEYIHIPHGWQAHPGSIESDSDRFPHGMKWLSDKIHDQGFRSSIHLTPYYVSVSSSLVDQCRRFLVYDKHSRLVELEVPEQDEPVALLDPSHPEAQAYLREMFETVSEQWQYDLITVDLLGYTHGASTSNSTPRYHRAGLTSAEIYRLALQVALETIGKLDRPTQLFPHCGGCATGLDMLPVSTINPSIAAEEVIPAWETRMGIRQRVRSWAARQYLNGTVSANDVGVLRLAQPRPINEVLIALTASLFSGGLLTLGDEWSSLEKGRLEILSRALPLLGKPCRVLDVYQEPYPVIWHLPLDDVSLLALFNWGDYEEDIRLNLSKLDLPDNQAFLVQDFWSGEFVGSFQDSLELLNVPARSVRLLGLRSEERVPQFLSIDTHLGQGTLDMLSTGWDSRSQTLLGVCQLDDQSDATITVHVPTGYLPASMSCYGANYAYQWMRPLYEVRLSRGQGIAQFGIHFGRTSG